MYKFLILVFASICTWSCSPEEEATSNFKNFTLLNESTTGVDFVNEVEDQVGFNVLTYRNYYNGGGVAIGDVNNDGLADLFFTANMSSNKLYLNKGDLEFEDISVLAGVQGVKPWSTGATMADVNGDGYLDIYVCNSGDLDGDNKGNELYINNGDMTFTEAADEYGLNDTGFSTHASFFDYDRDGDIDMYLVNNSFKDPSRIDFTNVRNQRNDEGGDKLFRNDGDKFVDVSEGAGIYGSKIGFGLGVSISDLNQDNWPDIYVSNDFWERDYLYINNGDGTFSEDLTNRIPMTSTASMGADIADIDNNGSYEIFSTDMLPATNQRLKRTTIFNDYNLEDLRYRNDYHYQYTQNCLQLNDGTGNFTEVSNLLGLAATDWSWGALMFDFNNDGLKDIFVSNGVYHDITDLDFSDFIEDKEEVAKVVAEKGRFDFTDFLEILPSNKMSNYAFVNKGDLSFSNDAESLGLGMPSFSNGSSYADLDNDGDLDLVINNVNMPVHIYRNNTESTNQKYIKLEFKGRGANTFGLGAQVEIHTNDRTYYYQNYSSRGFQSSTPPTITAGIGSSTIMDKITVRWPSGLCSYLTNVEANQKLVFEEEKGSECAQREVITTSSFLAENSVSSNNDSKHNENLFNDFDYEALMPHMVSTEGPEVLVGDLNGDKLHDYVLLGSAESVDKVFIQNKDGGFTLTYQPILDSDGQYESKTGHLIDIDSDGDLDMIIGNGGNDPSKPFEDYALRIYSNNGGATFSKMTDGGLKANGNFSVIEEFYLRYDIRALFIGGRIVPGNYGLNPRNFLFVELAPGQWQDMTTEETGQIGMVTDALAVDIDNDKDQDLIVVGEWTAIHIFENVQGQLKLKGLVPNSNGLWQKLAVIDANGDGMKDIVAGNWGNNSKFQASVDKPLMMFVDDFDQNTKSECIIQWYAPDDEEPSLFASKGDLTGQLPILKKKILKNYDYSSSSIEDVFTKEQLSNSLKKVTNNLNTSILMNLGDFRFNLERLPMEAQIAPVFGIHTTDLNSDGKDDIVMGGNFYGLKPEVGRMNSSKGLALLSNGDGTFRVLSKEESGLDINGEIRDIKPITLQHNKKALIFGINNQLTRVYTINDGQ